jgi:uncharacterized membrane protein YphA (DoxX/SURF4 family)
LGRADSGCVAIEFFGGIAIILGLFTRFFAAPRPSRCC